MSKTTIDDPQALAPANQPPLPTAGSPSDSSYQSDTSDHPSNQLKTTGHQLPTNPVHSNGHTAKISLLPVELREYINEQLLFSTPNKAIVDELKRRGHPEISSQNITNWRQGGYQSWLRSKQTLEQQAQQREAALKHAQQTGSRLEEALYHLNLQNLFEAASSISPEQAIKDSKDQANLLIKVVQGSSRLVKD